MVYKSPAPQTPNPEQHSMVLWELAGTPEGEVSAPSLDKSPGALNLKGMVSWSPMARRRYLFWMSIEPQGLFPSLFEFGLCLMFVTRPGVCHLPVRTHIAIGDLHEANAYGTSLPQEPDLWLKYVDKVRAHSQ